VCALAWHAYVCVYDVYNHVQITMFTCVEKT
jgi:hypothetical protein